MYRTVCRGAATWTGPETECYNRSVFVYMLYAFCGGFAAFLLGLAVFMYRENRKFGDNQFTMKLLPPPPRLHQAPHGELADKPGTPSPAGPPASSTALLIDDWTAGAVQPVEPSRAAAPHVVSPPA